jgi:hypothetical protein
MHLAAVFPLFNSQFTLPDQARKYKYRRTPYINVLSIQFPIHILTPPALEHKFIKPSQMEELCAVASSNLPSAHTT